MRPSKHPENHLLRPLNDILGTQANVRLVRALSLSPVPLTAGELAKRAQLGRTSIYPALRELERAGVIEFVGAGAQRQVQLRRRHPLASVLTKLFRAEAGSFEELIAALRELLEELPLRPISVWADERAQDAQSERTLKLYFVARPEELEKFTEHVNSSLSKIEHAFDTHIEVKGLTRSEFVSLYGTQQRMLSEAVLISGVPPAALLAPSRAPATKPSLKSHNEHDARARRLALAIATKIKRDPGLISLAAHRMRRRASQASPGERRELTEWIRALSTMSPARLRSFLLEDSERAIRLRQSLPALNLLSPSERNAVIESQTDADVIAAVTRR